MTSLNVTRYPSLSFLLLLLLFLFSRIHKLEAIKLLVVGMKLGLWTSEGDSACDAMTEVLLCEESTAWGMTLHTLVETELSSLLASCLVWCEEWGTSLVPRHPQLETRAPVCNCRHLYIIRND